MTERKRNRTRLALALCCVVTNCGGEEKKLPSNSQQEQPALVQGTEQRRIGIAPPAQGPRPTRKTVRNAKQTFVKVMQLIEEKYVDRALDADVLWTGAIEGVLGRLLQTKQKRINTLLTPGELGEMRQGLKGTFSGIGLVIDKVEDLAVVRHVLAGGPAKRAGVRSGDRILAVGGKRVDALGVPEITALIRGRTGTPVELFLQRDTTEWTLRIDRGPIALKSVRSKMLQPNVGYLHIAAFNQSTVEQLDDAVKRLLGRGAKRLVVDLRNCPGGLLDSAVAVTERFLEPGKAIVRLRDRNGTDDVRQATESNAADRLPLAILIDRSTASGAEILAGALADHGRAVLIGEPSYGKGTVETVLELDHGWGVKLSVARLYSPHGRAFQYDGVIPDFAVAPALNLARTPFGHPAADAARDPLIKAALRSLSLGRP
jgi:carboxyl-terminal processing protease